MSLFIGNVARSVRLEEMEEDFQIVKEDLDFLYETVFPQVPSVSVENVPEYTQTIEIPEDKFEKACTKALCSKKDMIATLRNKAEVNGRVVVYEFIDRWQ